MIAEEIMRKSYAKIDKNETISKLIGLLIRTNERQAIVLDKKKYIGVSSRDFLLKTKIDPAEMKISRIIDKTPKLNGKEDITETARLLYTSNTSVLPVIEKNLVIGAVFAVDIVNQLKNMPEKKIKAGEIMKSKLISINEKDRIGKAFEIMFEQRISRMPIVDSKGNISGIISFEDIMANYQLNLLRKTETRAGGKEGVITNRMVSSERVDMHGFPVESIGSKDSITCSKKDSVSKIIDDINEYHISSVIVAEDNKPVGIITARDLLKLFLKGISY